ncbi:hypothetical protein TNCV_4948261 [Trichonephila clavipes]|nr:hypothetical protein TNCV_4948261 [Trichonephila clavipes]
MGFMVAQRLTQITPPAATPDLLWQRVEAAWSAVPQELIQSLFESIPRRVAAILLWSPCGSTAADSVQSGWPDIVTNSYRQLHAVFAQAQLKTRTKTFELVEEKQKLLDIREKGERERCASRRYLLHIIVKLIC